MKHIIEEPTRESITMRRDRRAAPTVPSIKDSSFQMGSVRIDHRTDVVRITFYVGNGKKQIPRLTIEVKDVSLESIGAAVEEGFTLLRGPSTS